MLAERLAGNFGCEVGYSVLPYEARVHAAAFDRPSRLGLVIGAVDNAAARRAIAATLDEQTARPFGWGVASSAQSLPGSFGTTRATRPGLAGVDRGAAATEPVVTASDIATRAARVLHSRGRGQGLSGRFDTVRAGGTGRLPWMAHSATARLITQAEPIRSTRLNSPGEPKTISPIASVSACVPAPSPSA